jgi:hypothetical protein
MAPWRGGHEDGERLYLLRLATMHAAGLVTEDANTRLGWSDQRRGAPAVGVAPPTIGRSLVGAVVVLIAFVVLAILYAAIFR